MQYWEKVVERLSVPGLMLLTVGIVLCLQSAKLSQLVWKEKGERAILPLRILGLALAIAGAVILLDLIPGL